MSSHTGSPPTGATRADIVIEICRRVADQHGDIEQLIRNEVKQLAPLLGTDDQLELAEQAAARLSGLGELDIHLRDAEVDEVLVNAGSDIWIDRSGELERAGSLTADRVDHLIERILAPLGRRVDRMSPIVDARLPDGSRVCAVFPPVAVDGPTLSIRKFSNEVRNLAEFTDASGVALCRQVLDRRCNVVVTGATSSGKTSLVAALLASIPNEERLVVIEDTTELPVSGSHVVRLEARPPAIDGPPAVRVADLVSAALRLRPDRIVVGEVRGHEVLALMQAMNTGHDGSLSTCHANGPLDALLRLESLVLQAAPTWPLAAIRQQLARSLDVIVHVGRAASERRILSISEVTLPEAQQTHTLAVPEVRVLYDACPDHARRPLADLTRSRR